MLVIRVRCLLPTGLLKFLKRLKFLFRQSHPGCPVSVCNVQPIYPSILYNENVCQWQTLAVPRRT